MWFARSAVLRTESGPAKRSTPDRGPAAVRLRGHRLHLPALPLHGPLGLGLRPERLPAPRAAVLFVPGRPAVGGQTGLRVSRAGAVGRGRLSISELRVEELYQTPGGAAGRDRKNSDTATSGFATTAWERPISTSRGSGPKRFSPCCSPCSTTITCPGSRSSAGRSVGPPTRMRGSWKKGPDGDFLNDCLVQARTGCAIGTESRAPGTGTV